MEPEQRWIATKKSDGMLQVFRREKEMIDTCRTYDLRQSEILGVPEGQQRQRIQRIVFQDDQTPF